MLDYFAWANFCMYWGVMHRFKQINNVSQCCQKRNFSLVKRYNMTFKNAGQLFSNSWHYSNNIYGFLTIFNTIVFSTMNTKSFSWEIIKKPFTMSVALP